MFKNITPITYEKHKDYKVKPIDNFDFVKNVHLASVVAHEFSAASNVYPILFLEDKESDKFRPIVLLGLEDGKNLFVKNGKWLSGYVPAVIKRYPFILAKAEDENYVVCVDQDSEFLSKEEGEPLFNEDKTPSELSNKAKDFLAKLQQMELFTEGFCKDMKSENMFTPLNIKAKVKDEIKQINGAYVINEERLNSLNDEKFLEFRKKGYVPVIYSHLSSLSNIENLLKMAGEESVAIEKILKRFD